MPILAVPQKRHRALERTPLLISDFRAERTGTRRHSLVQSVDIVPTLLAWFGISTNEAAMHGQDLLGEVTGASELSRDCIVLGSLNEFSALRTKTFLLIRNEIDSGRESPHSTLLET